LIVDQVGKHKVNRYSSIDEMPIVRFMTFNRFVLIDSGIGSNLEDIDAHDARIIKYAHKQDFERVAREIENRNQAVRMIIENLNPQYMAYAALIKDIDGEPCDDLSEEGLKATVERLAKMGVTHGFIERIKAIVTKKLEAELDAYFPNKFSQDPKSREAYFKRKERLMVVLHGIVDGKEDEDRLREIDDYLYRLSKPKKYVGTDGLYISYQKEFEEMSFTLSQKTSRDPKKMTVLEYYQAFATLKRQTEESKKKT
jgi:hypothetical protein